jgi:GT2 family glycosyltransferase
MKKKVFIAVNYGTSHLIAPWSQSIKRCIESPVLVVIDNYRSDEERNKVQDLCISNGVDFIASNNVGYGRALNHAISSVLSQYKGFDIDFFVGNIDVEYTKIGSLPDGDFVFMATALEGRRNRNPFLTEAQMRFLPLHWLTLQTMSPFVLIVVTTILKVIGYFPSRPWAVHGSVFCFSSRILKRGCLFNEDSFLYSEELEFASYARSVGAQIVKVDIEYIHIAHASTSNIIKNRKDFLRHWRQSFINWRSRW